MYIDVWCVFNHYKCVWASVLVNKGIRKRHVMCGLSVSLSVQTTYFYYIPSSNFSFHTLRNALPIRYWVTTFFNLACIYMVLVELKVQDQLFSCCLTTFDVSNSLCTLSSYSLYMQPFYVCTLLLPPWLLSYSHTFLHEINVEVWRSKLTYVQKGFVLS